MDIWHKIFWFHDQFLGITWNGWKLLGWGANAVFSTRFIVQWYATEKRKQVVVPMLFWWLSLVGSLLFLIYAVFYEKDSVFILAYALNWVPYIRNLVIHARHEKSRQLCPECGVKSPTAKANFCGQCGAHLSPSAPVPAVQR